MIIAFSKHSVYPKSNLYGILDSTTRKTQANCINFIYKHELAEWFAHAFDIWNYIYHVVGAWCCTDSIIIIKYNRKLSVL